MASLSLRPHNRLFVALDLPGEIRRELAERGRALATALGGRPVAEGSMHVTLGFLGRVAAERGNALGDALEGAFPGPAPRLELGELVAFPRRSRATVVAVELRDPEGALAALHARVTAAVGRVLEAPGEDRPLRPHVTLVRFRRPARVGRLEPMDEERVFDCSRCALYDSHQTPGSPPRYEALVMASLGTPASAREPSPPAAPQDSNL